MRYIKLFTGVAKYSDHINLASVEHYLIHWIHGDVVIITISLLKLLLASSNFSNWFDTGW